MTGQMMDAFDREEQMLIESHACGDLTDAELREELRELQRDARAAVEAGAEAAYDEVMGNYGGWR